MPAVRQQRRKRFQYRELPTWLQWVLPFGIAIIVVLSLVVYVHHETNGVPSEAAVNSPSAIEAENHEADVNMRKQEVPHTATVKLGTKPAEGLKSAISIWLDGQIKSNQMNGPLTGGSCKTTAGSTSTRVAMECTMVTANVNYPFYGVVTTKTGDVTFCQKVVPPVYGMPGLALSKRCLAA